MASFCLDAIPRHSTSSLDAKLTRLVSRLLALVVAVAAMLRVLPNSSNLVRVLLAVALPTILIWFPEQVDEYTFGTWYKGNRIDSHTPPLMIAIFGWTILLLEASVIFDPAWIMRFFYGA